MLGNFALDAALVGENEPGVAPYLARGGTQPG